jgi:hypothetical protein
MTHRPRYDVITPDREERLVADEQRLDPSLYGPGESRLDIGTGTCRQEREPHSKRARGRHHLGHVRVRSIRRIDAYNGRGGVGYQAAQKFELLDSHCVGGEHGHSDEIANGPVEARDKNIRLYFTSWEPEAMGDSDLRAPQ